MKAFLLVILSTLFFTSAFAHHDGGDHEKCHDEGKKMYFQWVWWL
jgi:hypothetical protein